MEIELAKDRQRALSLVPVSRETEERFNTFIQLLSRWRQKVNLISDTAFASVWSRHLVDSAQIHFISPPTIKWLDIGSGAGFPGLVLAMQLAPIKGGVVHCVESDQRKCAFLREVARAVCVPAIVHSTSIQAIDATALGVVDGVTARAVAPLSRTLALANDWLRAGTLGIFPRGQSKAGQIQNMSLNSSRRYDVDYLPNILDASASFLRLQVTS
jgi:16S rRNA (guanine527-N7)-methyltransferase